MMRSPGAFPAAAVSTNAEFLLADFPSTISAASWSNCLTEPGHVFRPTVHLKYWWWLHKVQSLDAALTTGVCKWMWKYEFKPNYYINTTVWKNNSTWVWHLFQKPVTRVSYCHLTFLETQISICILNISLILHQHTLTRASPAHALPLHYISATNWRTGVSSLLKCVSQSVSMSWGRSDTGSVWL